MSIRLVVPDTVGSLDCIRYVTVALRSIQQSPHRQPRCHHQGPYRISTYESVKREMLDWEAELPIGLATGALFSGFGAKDLIG